MLDWPKGTRPYDGSTWIVVTASSSCCVGIRSICSWLKNRVCEKQGKQTRKERGIRRDCSIEHSSSQQVLVVGGKCRNWALYCNHTRQNWGSA